MKSNFLSACFAAVILSFASAAVAGDVFYWYGDWNQTKTWGDYTDYRNWSLSRDAYSNPDRRVPGAADRVWTGGWLSGSDYFVGYFDLKGTEQTIAGWSVGTGLTQNWVNYGIHLTNGTFTVSDPICDGLTVGHLTTIWNGATLIYPRMTTTRNIFASSLDEQLRIKAGGRAEVYCSMSLEGGSDAKGEGGRRGAARMTVEEGGTLIFDPVDIWTASVNRKGVEFINSGVMQFPHGFTWSKAGAKATNSDPTDRIEVRQSAGTMLIGGDFVKTDKNKDFPGQLDFVLAGGTLEITNVVRFYTAETAYDLGQGWTDQVFARMPDGASATVDVKVGSKIDMTPFTYGSNASLVKTGPGTLVIGANRPSSLEVQAGSLGFVGPVSLDGITLGDDAAVSFEALDMTASAAVVSAAPHFTFGTAFAEGDTIVTVESAEQASAVIAKMIVPPAFAGFSVRAEGNRVVLVKGDAVEAHTYYWRNSSSEWMSIRDIAGWYWAKDGSVRAERLPCSCDDLWGNKTFTTTDFAHFDCGGRTLNFASFVCTPSGTSGIFLLAVTNGTMNMTALRDTSRTSCWNLEVWNGGRIVLDGTAKHIYGKSSNGGDKVRWTVKDGGRIDLVHGSPKDYDRMTADLSARNEFNMLYLEATVEEGGTLLFDPVKFCMNNGSHNSPVTFTNRGTFIAPHGVVWNGYDPWTDNGCKKQFVLTQQAGTMYLGGNFTKVIAESTANHPASMKFVFAGGTLVTSNDVAFLKGVLSQNTYEVEAEMTGSATVRTEEGSTLDLGIMTFADGVTLTKEGAGRLRVVNRPPALAVTAGSVEFANALTDCTGLALADGTHLVFSTSGNDISGLANADKLTYGVGDGIDVGDTVVTAASAEQAAAIAANMTLPSRFTDYGYVPAVEGTSVKIMGALTVTPRNVTLYVGDAPVDHGFVIQGMAFDADVSAYVTGTPVYDFGGYAAGSPAGTYVISVSGLTGVKEPVKTTTATLTVLEPTVSETFYWQGGTSAWADFGSLANWAMDRNGTEPATRLPGAHDSVWGGGTPRTVGDFGDLGKMDLCGQEYAVKDFVLTAPITAWKMYLLQLRRGTLHVVDWDRAQNLQNGTEFEVSDGGCVDVAWPGVHNAGVGGIHNEDWVAKSGGAFSLRGVDFVSYNTRFLVEAGGTFHFAPATCTPYNQSETGYPFVMRNAGTFVAPNGILWNREDTASYSTSRIKIWRFEQNAGTLYLGGDFTKTVPATGSDWREQMDFVFAGGTIVASNQVAFCNRVQSFGVNQVSAAMTGSGTVDVAEGATLDFDIFTYSDGVTLTKNGPGLLKFGANLPSAVVANAGRVEFPALAGDESLTFADGVTVVFGAVGNRMAAPANFAALGFALDPAKFAAGATVLASDDGAFLAAVAEKLAATAPAGTRATVKDGALVLEPTGDNVFAADGTFNLNEAAKWGGKAVPAGEDVIVYGDKTVALIDNATPKFKSIKVVGGAKLAVDHGTVEFPPVEVAYPSELSVKGGTLAILTNGFVTVGDANGLPVLSVETNGELRVVAETKFKNVDIRLCGTLSAISPTGTGPGQLTLGYAEAAETAFFAFSSVGGTLKYVGGHDTTSYGGTSRRFVVPELGGRVVVTRPILIKDTTFVTQNGSGSFTYMGFLFGYNNPEDEPFEVVFDNTQAGYGRTLAFRGGAHVRLTNGSVIKNATYHPGVAAYVERRENAKVTVEGEGSALRLENADPYKYDFLASADGACDVTIGDGGRLATHNTTCGGSRKGVIRFADGVYEVPNLPYLPPDLNPHPADNDVLNWMSDLLRGFLAVDVPEGKKMTVTSADVFGSAASYGGGYRWNRNVKLADIPVTGGGDFWVSNETPGYSMTLTLVNGANTCTGRAGIDANAQGAASLLFADGANWAGTVVGGPGVGCTNLVDAAAPAEVSFAALELVGSMPVRVWTQGGAVASDTINVGAALTGSGRFAPKFVDGKPKSEVTFTVGRYPAAAGVPDAKFAKKGCTFSVEPIAGTDDVWLKMTYTPTGSLLIVR